MMLGEIKTVWADVGEDCLKIVQPAGEVHA